ncbi:L-ribulokinase [Cytobacillus eiseniae]|uniref:Ribulokinase n=1 Tax=Cytobacillus eiseniae TaxID=762947 RepID=A0ABS4RBI2_9BACI|nr:ribulokinase [Cytobacillus eiseniae]MBP2240264.1 L-ribulokinase [Cytobacillus eiseniae]
MNEKKYSIGIDYGTESGRAVLVDVTNGELIATHVTEYRDGVIDKQLPNSDIVLAPSFALQNPANYLTVLFTSVPEVIKQSGIDPADVIGLGIDFTACTILPTDEELRPLCLIDRLKDNPHSWVKLWKHHAAQNEANRINQLASLYGGDWLKRYGGKISSEWMLPKVWQILNEAPEIYDEAVYFLEAADWITAKLTGNIKRNSCAAGYKGIWHKQDGYLPPEFLNKLDSRLADIYETKLSGEVVPIGSKAGELRSEMAEFMGLSPGISVSVGIIDAHAGVPGVGVTDSEKMVMVMGTSSCHMLLSEKELLVEGMSGVVEDGIIPGLFAYEAGQAAVGDIFAWYINQSVPSYIEDEARNKGISIHELLEKKASRLKPGESGLIALDWQNGNRTPLVDADLSGLLIGLTLSTTPEEIYLALIESTAFGTRSIIETFRKQGVAIKELYACGGLPHRNKRLMQIYADVTNMEIKISNTTLTSSIGAAMYGAVAAGSINGGYDSIIDAARNMAQLKNEAYYPMQENVRIYEKLYQEYIRLHDYFGRGENNVMKCLKEIKESIR